ncbi:methyltransferase [Streptomyces olivaceus]|uniref:methyltransferase n=1 Tax=Streptomyces olivaceus TaxID=47716 RepID=UPI00069376A1|nr:methyltransferase [Streptomyces olivaceus]MBZ6102774.1 methyltransferase [Streptomyces olivaceus]
MKLTDDILTALRERTAIDGTHLVLTGPRMDPKLYQRVNEVLEAVGGRWTTNEQAHVFPVDAAQALAPVLESGQVVTLREKRQSAQYFPTPSAVVQRLIDLAAIKPGMEVLEPSAGSGAIATAATTAGAVVDCIERDPGYAAVLTDTGVARTLTVADFLTVPAQPCYDRIVMNPPFTKGADMQHIEHALRFLKPDGLLVSVMSWAVTFQGRKTAKFRSLVEARGGTVEAVAGGAFKESGTDVDTVIVTIPASRPANAKPTTWPTREIPEQPETEFRNPMEILDELRDNVRDAMAEFDALADMLAQPLPKTDVVELPTAREEQLTFDLGEAS